MLGSHVRDRDVAPRAFPWLVFRPIEQMSVIARLLSRVLEHEMIGKRSKHGTAPRDENRLRVQ